MVLICFTGDTPCLNDAARRVGGAPSRTIQTAISQKSWGTVLPQRSYTIIFVQPRG